jgi:hypothetical protein
MTPNAQVPRYSPKAIEAYDWVYRGETYGPSKLTFIHEVRTWNLAFLSFEFERACHHEDSCFAVHVRRTLQAPLDGGMTDITVDAPYRDCVGSMLQLAAPQAVYRISKLDFVHRLPLFAAYGESWLQTMNHRAKKFSVSDEVFPRVRNLHQARALLAAIADELRK